MEINPWHGHLTVDELVFCSKYDVKFVISSDAHKPENVGSFERGLDMAFEAGLDAVSYTHLLCSDSINYFNALNT